MHHRSREQTLDFLLADGIKLGTASGIFTTKPEMIGWVDDNMPEIVLQTSKSYTVLLRVGNREPIVAENSVGNYRNAVGLRNPGMDKGYKDLLALRQSKFLRTYLNVSVAGNTIEDFVALIKRFEDIADIIELNFSCPNVPVGGSTIGCDVGLVRQYVRELRKITQALLFPKLSPDAKNIGEIAAACLEEGADGLVGVNTFEAQEEIEPHTGRTILYNPNRHIGGKSGEWIREVAIQKISEMRRAIGEKYPIIGMGGVTTGEDVRRMSDIANVVCLGSVFARVPMSKRPSFVSMLKRDAEHGSNNAFSYVSRERLAEYVPHRITRIDQIGDDLRVFEVEGSLEYKASQFAFLWVPDVGEKPFSIATGDPLRFVVRKRKYDSKNNEGLVTHALFQLREGDELMIRGVYGADVPNAKNKDVYIVAGGTGIAVVPRLAEKLYEQGKRVIVYYGVTSAEQAVLKDEIERFAEYRVVTDDGVKGRVVDFMKQELGENLNDVSFYNVGPAALMKKAMEAEESIGADPKEIFATLETRTMCGIGLCSECVCGKRKVRLTCQEGTTVSWDYLKSEGIDIMVLEK